MSRRQRGQSLVEFTLIFTFVFLPLLFGLIEGARFVYTNNALSNAAREGARVASVEAGWIGQSGNGCNAPGGPTCPATLGAFTANVVTAANGEMVATDPLGTSAPDQLTVTCSSPCAAGGTVTVSVTYHYVLLLPVFNPVQLHATAVMVIQ
jgi:TadE-like protein